jgi:hypothetical protein
MTYPTVKGLRKIIIFPFFDRNTKRSLFQKRFLKILTAMELKEPFFFDR